VKFGKFVVYVTEPTKGEVNYEVVPLRNLTVHKNRYLMYNNRPCSMLSVHFLDNSTSHYERCAKAIPTHATLKCIKVQETARCKVPETEGKILSEQHYPVIEEIFKTPASPDYSGYLSCAICTWIVLQENNCHNLFDSVSGLKSEQVVEGADLYVFDWDRTITQAEGFLGEPTRMRNFADIQATYLESVTQCFVGWTFNEQDLPHDRLDLFKSAFIAERDLYKSNPSEYPRLFNTRFTAENFTRVLCGGLERYNMLQKTLRPIANKAYILTANRSAGLIADLAATLFGETIKKRVMSTHNPLVAKYQHKKIDLILDYIVPDFAVGSSECENPKV